MRVHSNYFVLVTNNISPIVVVDRMALLSWDSASPLLGLSPETAPL